MTDEPASIGDGPPLQRGVLTLHDRHPAVHWAALLALTFAFVSALELLRLPAAMLMGAMAAAILLRARHGGVEVPRMASLFAQGLVGCLIGRSVGPSILSAMLGQWAVFLSCIAAVIVFSTGLGYVLARAQVLPGTTAVWGSAPGAATAMTLMSGAFGADDRLVAFMQFLRVVIVVIVASTVARLWAGPAGSAAQQAVVWFPPVAVGPLCATLALAAAGALAGHLFRIPAGPLLLPLFVGAALSGAGSLRITLPPWLLAGGYTLVGWTIGLRFTRDILAHATRALVRVTLSIFVLIALCGGLAVVLHFAAGTDPLTAYLATSPGGADSVAIIAATSKVDMPFVMAMQTGRFLLVLFLGPMLSRRVARWSARPPRASR